MENGKNLWPFAVLLFGVIGFLVVYRYFIHRSALSVPPVEEEGELVNVR